MEKHAAEASNAVIANNNKSRCRPNRWSSDSGGLEPARTTERQTSRTSSTLRSGNSNDPVVLLAIVELDFAAASHGDGDLFVTKLRIRASEVVEMVPDVADESECVTFSNNSFHLVYTARQLRTKIQQNFACSVAQQWDELLDISIFDTVLNMYVPLPPDDVGFNVVKQYGKRWRIRLAERHATNAQISKHQLLQPPVLAIQGRYFDFDGSLTLTAANNEKQYQLQFTEMPNQPNAGTGFNVWDGALLLARYLADVPMVLQGRRVLELGAGSSGVPGLAAAVLGAQHVTLTDLPEIIPFLQATVNCNMDTVLLANKNNACRRNRVYEDEDLISFRPCNWYSPPQDLLTKRANGEPPFDVILVADCVWMEHLVAPLFDVLKRLTDETTTTAVTISEEAGRGAVEKKAVRNEEQTNLENEEITIRDKFSNHYISTMNVGLFEDESPDSSWSDIYKGQCSDNGRSRSMSKKSNHQISYSNMHESPPVDNDNDFVWPIYQNIKDERLSFSQALDFEGDQRDDMSATLLKRHHAKISNGEQQSLSFQQGDNRPRVIISYQRRGKATHDAFHRGLHEIFSHVEVLKPANFDMPDVFHLLLCQR